MAVIVRPPGSLPNGATINGVQWIVQSSRPTTRVDGSALVVGDAWYNTSTGDNWSWNGTYWLSSNFFTQTLSRSANTAGTADGDVPLVAVGNGNVFLESVGFLVRTPSFHDVSNFCNYNLAQAQDGLSSFVTIFSISTSDIAASTTTSFLTTRNEVLIRPFRLRIQQIANTGGPGAVSIAANFRIRRISP